MGHDHNHAHGKLGWTIILNIVITISEYVGGIMSGSLSLIADASHNLSDVISLIISYFGERISKKHPNEHHSFGYKRAEVFTALINAISLFAIGIFILYEAWDRLDSNYTISLGIMFGVGFIGLLGNFFSIIILSKEKDKNLNMKSAYLHLFYDTISSIFVLISAVVIYYTGLIILDLIVSIFIALMIFYSGFGMVKNSIHILMQGVPNNLNARSIKKEIGLINNITKVHSFYVWAIDSNEVILSCHICKKDIKVKNDDLLNEINKMLKDKYKITNTTIQIEEKLLCKNTHNHEHTHKHNTGHKH